MCFPPQRRALFRHLNFQKWSGPGVLCAFSLRNVLRATMPCTFSTSQLPKVLRMVCFVHFDFEMCFVPQRRALFRHLNFQFCTFDFETCFAPQRCALLQHLNIQKCSEREVFCTFWLRNVLPTTACTFSSLIWPDGSAPAALASLLFDPPEPQIIEKTVFRDFPTFSRTWASFFWLSLLWSSLFYSSLLSDSSRLCFSSAHIVGSLTSKLPSMICSALNSALSD